MTDKKSWGATVAGWFIERDDNQPAGATEAGSDAPDGAQSATGELSPSLPGSADYSTPSPTQGVFQTPPPAAVGGQVDFEAVFASAGVSADERQRVAKTIELLRGLPAGTEAAVKKQIVEAALKAFGVPIEKIIEASVEEIQALDGYVRNGAADNEKLIQESDARIKQYEEEIKNIRAVMQQSVEEQQAVIKVCNDKKLEVQQVLEFFGQDAVARVVKASPKLHNPSTQAETPAS
jgi:DNA repair protein RadC